MSDARALTDKGAFSGAVLSECAGVSVLCAAIPVFAVMFFPLSALMAGESSSRAGNSLISIQDAYALYRNGRPVFIDARREQDYRQAHIPDAINIESGRVTASLERIGHVEDAELIVYCYRRGGVAAKLAGELRAHGITRFRILEGHWAAWIRAGYPTTAMDKGKRAAWVGLTDPP